MKARCRPLGENTGLSLLPSLCVNCVTARGATSMTLMSNRAPVRDSKAISLVAVDHVGLSAYGSAVSRCTPPRPSADTIYICGVPDRSDWKAISFPFGDHVGVVSSDGPFVSR